MRELVIAGALAVGILSPLVLPPSWDSFPISSYPMFSRDVGRIVTLGHAIAIGEDGSRTPVEPKIVGTPEPMVAKNILERAIANGSAQDLCLRIAARSERAARIEIVTSTWDSRTYFGGDRSPAKRTVHASCSAH